MWCLTTWGVIKLKLSGDNFFLCFIHGWLLKHCDFFTATHKYDVVLPLIAIMRCGTTAITTIMAR